MKSDISVTKYLRISISPVLFTPEEQWIRHDVLYYWRAMYQARCTSEAKCIRYRCTSEEQCIRYDVLLMSNLSGKMYVHMKSNVSNMIDSWRALYPTRWTPEAPCIRYDVHPKRNVSGTMYYWRSMYSVRCTSKEQCIRYALLLKIDVLYCMQNTRYSINVYIKGGCTLDFTLLYLRCCYKRHCARYIFLSFRSVKLRFVSEKILEYCGINFFQKIVLEKLIPSYPALKDVQVWDFLPLHCKKRLTVFLSPAGMSMTKLSLAGNNQKIPGQGEFGKWHPGWGRENR